MTNPTDDSGEMLKPLAGLALPIFHESLSK